MPCRISVADIILGRGWGVSQMRKRGRGRRLILMNENWGGLIRIVVKIKNT